MNLDFYRLAFDKLSTSLWVEDIRSVRAVLRSLDRSGEALERYLDDNPEFLRSTAAGIEVIDVNRATLSIYEATDKTQLLGPLERTLDLTDPVILDSLRWNILAIAEGRTGITRESQAITANGKRIDVLVTVHIPSDSAPVDPMIVEIQDITERRALQRSVERERALLRTVINSIPDYVYIKDREHRFTLANRALADAMSVSAPADMMGKSDFDFFPRKRAAEFMADEREVMERAVPIVDKMERNPLPGGGFRWVLTTKLPLRDRDGNITGLVGLGKDITGLREAEEKLRAFVDQSTEAIWVVGQDARLVEFNHSAERLTGLTREEAIGEYGWELMSRITLPDRWNEEVEARMKQEMQTALATGTSRFLDRPLSSTLRRPDGTIRHFEHFYFPIRTRDGFLIGTIAHDNTEVRNVRETLRRLENQLQQAQKMEAVGQLAGGIAHEFNNILTAIMGYTSMLRAQTEGDAEAQPLIDSIIAAVKRASHVTDGILLFSRRGKGSLRVIDFNRFVGNELEFLQRVIGPELPISFTPWKSPLPVRADETQLEQVLMNLAGNARDAVSGSGRIEVSLVLEQLEEVVAAESVNALPGPYAHLIFSDDGAGMDKPTRDRVFEPFFTTKPVGKGSGLGLAIVWGVVDQHAGFITVESEPGKGTSFHIHLPIAEQPPEEKSTLDELPVASGRGTILVAEDDAVLRRFVSTVLEEAGYTVYEAMDGEEAVSQFEQHRREIELVVIDSVLPKLSGREAYERMANRGQPVQALFMSGYVDRSHRGEPLIPEGVDVIHKPFSAAVLSDRVKGLISRP
ncbi:PAS domain-containing hybrid sensor histidine kinase/response regulator [Salinispira pacifica]